MVWIYHCPLAVWRATLIRLLDFRRKVPRPLDLVRPATTYILKFFHIIIFNYIIIVIIKTYNFSFSQIARNRNGRYLVTMNSIAFFYFHLDHRKRSAGHLFHFHEHSLRVKRTEYNLQIVMHLYTHSPFGNITSQC